MQSEMIDAKQRQQALAGWENEGGAGPCGPLETLRSPGAGHPLPKMGKAEMLALHIRRFGELSNRLTRVRNRGGA
jgi:hypothetical protein